MLQNMNSRGVLMFDMNLEKGIVTKQTDNHNRTTVFRLMPIEKHNNIG